MHRMKVGNREWFRTESGGKLHHDSVYWFDLNIAQDEGLVVLQTSSADNDERHLTERPNANRLPDNSGTKKPARATGCTNSNTATK